MVVGSRRGMKFALVVAAEQQNLVTRTARISLYLHVVTREERGSSGRIDVCFFFFSLSHAML